MAKGTTYPSESKVFKDRQTGTLIRQVTGHLSINHHPFFIIPAYDDKMNWLCFISHRTGSPQIYLEERRTGKLLQLTDREDISEWSVHPSHNGEYIYFVAGTCASRVSTGTLKEDMLVNIGEVSLRDGGMVASGLGTTALSRDDKWWAVHYSYNNIACLAVIETETGEWKTILQRDKVSHMQFCPDDPSLLYYAGPLTDRVWVINRDGSNNRRLYKRNAEKKEWITHESWVPGTKELAFVDWPNGIRCIQADTGIVREIAYFNAWHAVCDRSGTMMVADTNFPDTGIKVFKTRDGIGRPDTLCYPSSSSIGAHWNGPFPYDNGPVNVYAPQHTHPHPSFSPDGRLVVYTSDFSGYAQVYEAGVPEKLLCI